jgi:hypothetical protein
VAVLSSFWPTDRGSPGAGSGPAGQGAACEADWRGRRGAERGGGQVGAGRRVCGCCPARADNPLTVEGAAMLLDGVWRVDCAEFDMGRETAPSAACNLFGVRKSQKDRVQRCDKRQLKGRL